MGSHPTLDPVPTRPPDTSHQQHRDTRDGRDELLEHLQTPAAWGATSSATGPSTRLPTASAVTWTPATATTTPA